MYLSKESFCYFHEGWCREHFFYFDLFFGFWVCSDRIENFIFVSISVFKILVFLFPSPSFCVDISTHYLLHLMYLCIDYYFMENINFFVLQYFAIPAFSNFFFACSCFPFDGKLTFPDVLFWHIYTSLKVFRKEICLSACD